VGTDAGKTPATPVNVLTNRYDNTRSGANTNETLLTTSNVNTTTFGFKFSSPVTGRIYGQPLYVSGLTVGGASHNVVYVATEHNMVYAFDADSGASLWAKALEPPAILGSGNGATFNPGCADMGSGAANYEVGITSTPVIDLTTQLIYVVAKTSGKQMLHALSLTTGNDGPTATQVGPAGFSSDDVPLNRPGLLLFNGVVYIAYGSHCDNGGANGYHGWIFGQNATTLALTSTYNTTPSGSEGAIWQGGVGLSSDGSNIWFSVGNGTTGGNNVGMSVVQVTPSGDILQSHSESADGDNDLTAGAVLVSNNGTNYVLSGGKSGYVILLNASNVSNNPQLIQAGGEVQNVATWNGGAAGQFVYTWGTSAPLYAWQLTGGNLTAQQTYNLSSGNPGHPGGMVTISSNGTVADTGVLWALLPTSGDAWHSTAPGALYAFDATNIGNVLWNSNSDGTPLTPLGTYAKFSPPTVANGNVYCASFPSSTAEGATGELMVYGLK
jgi:outer membrane protein assembly factor BamB